MSAFKQLNTKDVTITPFDVSKEFSFTGTAMTASNVGIEVYLGQKSSFDVFTPIPSFQTGFVSKQYPDLVYSSAKQLYYTNYLSSSRGDLVPTQSIIPGVNRSDDRFIGPRNTPSFENYLQSSLTQSRFFPTGEGSDSRISVVSIPAKLFGENIVPYTFELEFTASDNSIKYNVKDDGEGNIILNSKSGSSFDGEVDAVVGQIFYSHGITVLTTGSVKQLGRSMGISLSNLDDLTINFQSSLRIYENQYKCTINENEFQFSLNPTLLSGSNNDVYYDFVTGSFFTPYVTTVGLYNESNELLMIGKLSNPIPISQEVDTTIIVNLDT